MVGPATTSSRNSLPARNAWIGPRGDPAGGGQLTVPHGGTQLAGAAHHLLHLAGGDAGADLVAIASEVQQEGVAAELEHVAAVIAGDGEQLAEDGAEHIGELLAADLARVARRSVSGVKPEMSKKTRVPGSSRQRRSGSSISQR